MKAPDGGSGETALPAQIEINRQGGFSETAAPPKSKIEFRTK